MNQHIMPSVRGWKTALPACVGALLVILVLYRETAMAMVEIWIRSETFAHAFLVPPISLGLIWRARRDLALLTPRPNAWVLLALVGTGFAWLLGDLAAVSVVTQFALVTMLVMAVPAILGLQVAGRILFPLAFLYFSVPFGEFALPQLMEWTANITVLGLRLSGIPVFREGLHFVIPSGNWSVVEACSGVRYIIASLTVGTIFAYLNYVSIKRRLIFVGVSLVVPLVANWMRAYIIVMLGHLSGNKLATGVDHLIYGWLFFGVVIFLMFIIGSCWAEHPSAVVMSREMSTGDEKETSPITYWLNVFLALLVLSMPLLAEKAIQKTAVTTLPVFPDLSRLERGWEDVGQALFPVWTPVFSNPSAEKNIIYAANGHVVGLYLGYYRQQNYERKLISSENVFVRSKDPVWALVSSGRAVMSFAGQTVTARHAELRAGDAQTALQRLSVRQIYWINGYLTSNDYLAKLLTAVMQLTGQGDDSAVIIIYAPKEQEGGGDQALSAFAEDNSARIQEILANVRADR